MNRAVLEGLPLLGVADAWLVSGSLFQSVWNVLTDRPAEHGIKDYDVFYFDSTDLSWEAEDRVIRRAQAVFADLPITVEVRNQARAHLWYPQKFGLPYSALTCATDSIDRFLATACMVGISKPDAETSQVYAPKGYNDLAGLTIRANPSANFSADRYREKADRWKANWPELRVLASHA